MSTKRNISKRQPRRDLPMVALLGLLLLLLVSSQPAQAQVQRALDSPVVVVEAGQYRLTASVGAPMVGAPLAVHRLHYRAASASETLTETTSVPASFALEGNYPNPFNPETTIPFAVPEASAVNVSVYNLLGRRVAVLVDGEMAAGRHEVRFRADDLASGVYLVRMQAGSFSHVRRMTLVK